MTRRMMWASALLLTLTIVGGTALTAVMIDDGPRRDTWGQLTEQGGYKPHIIPRPNEGRPPEDPGDRGGWAQFMVLGLIVVSVGGIATVIIRGTSSSRARRAMWLAAADSGRDGALDHPHLNP